MMQSGIPLCNTCGEQVGLDANGEVFVACHECNFPVCKTCFDMDIKEERKACLRCSTPYDDGISFTWISLIYVYIFRCFSICVLLGFFHIDAFTF